MPRRIPRVTTRRGVRFLRPKWCDTFLLAPNYPGATCCGRRSAQTPKTTGAALHRPLTSFAIADIDATVRESDSVFAEKELAVSVDLSPSATLRILAHCERAFEDSVSGFLLGSDVGSDSVLRVTGSLANPPADRYVFFFSLSSCRA